MENVECMQDSGSCFEENQCPWTRTRMNGEEVTVVIFAATRGQTHLTHSMSLKGWVGWSSDFLLKMKDLPSGVRGLAKVTSLIHEKLECVFFLGYQALVWGAGNLLVKGTRSPGVHHY